MRRILFLFSALMLFSTQVFASGFALKDQGTKAMGMGNAFIAVADDASAAWYNPAATSFLDGAQLNVGGQFIMPKTTFSSGAGSFEMDKKNHLVPFAYFTYNKDLPVAVGIAVNAPFGLSSDWTSAGTPFDSATSKITFSEIQMVNVNPFVSYKITDRLSVAVGVMYYNANKIAFDTSLLTQHGTGDGWGGNAALFYKGDNFNVGLSYRSRVKVDVKGTATAIGPLAAFGSTTVTSGVTFPDIIAAGVSFQPDDKWTLSLEADWTNWKTFDKLDFTRGKALGPIGTTSTVPENWKATTSLHAGVQWAYNKDMRVRVGYSFDPTPVSDVDFSPRIPDADRHLFTIGYGHDVSDAATIDVAYGYILGASRTVNGATVPTRDGTYKSKTHLVSVALSYIF